MDSQSTSLPRQVVHFPTEKKMANSLRSSLNAAFIVRPWVDQFETSRTYTTLITDKFRIFTIATYIYIYIYISDINRCHIFFFFLTTVKIYTYKNVRDIETRQDRTIFKIANGFFQWPSIASPRCFTILGLGLFHLVGMLGGSSHMFFVNFHQLKNSYIQQTVPFPIAEQKKRVHAYVFPDCFEGHKWLLWMKFCEKIEVIVKF